MYYYESEGWEVTSNIKEAADNIISKAVWYFGETWAKQWTKINC
jgi:hypothetical protein